MANNFVIRVASSRPLGTQVHLYIIILALSMFLGGFT